MKLNCLSCGHSIDLRDAYDDYEGQVKCFACEALLNIRTADGQVKRTEVATFDNRQRDGRADHDEALEWTVGRNR
jgi:hypothetical protein